jgi:L-asparaginase II
VEVTRGGRVESRHRGLAVVVDAAGALVAVFGDPDMPVYPRPAVKIIQALVLVESGGADAFARGEADLALACGSHSGGPEHTERAAAQLARLELNDAALVWGAHWPIMGAVLARIMPLDEADQNALTDIALPKFRDWNGVAVGDVRVRFDA